MLKATEARKIVDETIAERHRIIEEKAQKLCEAYSEDIKKRSRIGNNCLTIEKLPKDLYSKVCEILEQNGYIVYKLNFETVQFEW